MTTRFTKTLAVLFCFLPLCLNAQAQNKPEFYLRGLLEMFRQGAKTNAQRIALLNEMIPPDIKGQVVYSISAQSAWYYIKNLGDYTVFNDDNYLELCKRVDSTGFKFVVNIGEVVNYVNYPDPPASLIPNVGGYHIKPSQVDSIFKYTTNCVGIESGENFWTYNATTANQVIDLLRVCKKYNKKYILGEGGWGYNSFIRFFSEYYTTIKNEGLGAYLQPTFKNTKPYGALATQGSILGSWLTGLTGEFGTWNDEWTWCYGSFGHANQFPAYVKADQNQVKVPYTHYLKSWLLSIAMGGKINFMETSSFHRDGRSDPNFAHYLYPFIKGLLQHDMLPSKSAVLSKIKAMANPYGGTYTLSDGTTAEYKAENLVTYNYTKVNYKPVASGTNADPFARLYKMTSGIWADTTYTNTGSATDRYYMAASNFTGQKQLPNALIREVLPNNSRYLVIPILPHPSAASVVPSGVETVVLSSYQTDAGLKTKFESLYPAVAAGNDAWAVEIDNRFFVINSHENADIDQNFVFNLGISGIKSLSGTMPFQNILFGKREIEGNYWFQSSGYAVKNGITTGQKYECIVKTTTLIFNCDARPLVIVEDGKNASVQESWDAVTKTLTLIIDHLNGAVNFNVVSNTSSQSSQIITFNSLPTDKIPGDADFSPVATSTSGLPVSYTSSNPAVATIVNNQIHIVGTGTTQITAFQQGNAVYSAAPEVVQSLTILSTPISKPYAANVIPGIIEAENYDIGLEGNAYHDTGTGNTGDQTFRPGGDVDVNGCNDTGGGYKIQSIAAGEWLDYTIQVAATGNYLVNVRCSSTSNGGQFRIEIDGVNVSGIMNVPNTSSYTAWASVTKDIALIEGTHRMRVYFVNGGYQVNNLTFRGGQTITFNSLPADKIPGDADFSAAATSNSGLTVIYTSSNPAVATIVNNQVHIVSNGTTQITAQQPGNGLYTAAPDVLHTLTVLPSKPYVNNAIPGVIEAENYDIGIEGKAYHDSSPGNTGDQTFRPGGNVDVNTCNDLGGGHKIQSIIAGEWLDYTVQVAQTSNYSVDIRCAYNTTGGKFRIEIDGVDVSGVIDVPNTSNWISWASVSKQISLTAGTHRMRMYFINGGYHINKLTFSGAGGGGQMSAKQENSVGLIENGTGTVTGAIVYPNPFSGNEFNLRVYNKTPGDVNVTVYSTMGARIVSKKFAHVKQGESILNMQIPAINRGVYFVRMQNLEGIKTFKVIKE